ncbi:hypothetical protein RDV89_00140 [Nocardioides zeae]|uniref:STAS domain-containing protein n=1 Tax=Nocardioides imazamoxiresistens TaxID=3231893 RepID=A0ABU3PQF2_9ACTN|nr:hypothetical protein [Nocardioides zeae]MDT9591453.1 hypothetical protein [Nocardioides zeae]
MNDPTVSTARLVTHFRVDVDPTNGLVVVVGVVDATTVGTVNDCISWAGQECGSVTVDLREVVVLTAGATRHLETAVQAARTRGEKVSLVAPHGSMAFRVLSAVRSLLGTHADRLPLQVADVPTGAPGARPVLRLVPDPAPARPVPAVL